MKRTFHHHDKWEDHKAGMYAITCDNQSGAIQRAKQLLSNPYMLETYMRAAATFWTFSAEHNLSCISRNRQAWLGQAACCYFAGCPEYTTKMAWRLLTDKQRDEANAVADKIIEEWEERYVGYGKQVSLFD